MIISDEQTQDLASAQIFQWASFKTVIVRGETMLMGTRLDADEHGLYEFPGGKAEIGESIDEAISREVKEETGLIVDSTVAYKVVTIGQNEKRNIVVIFCFVTVLDGELNPEVEELGEMRFYTREELRELLATSKMRKSSEPIVTRFITGTL